MSRNLNAALTLILAAILFLSVNLLSNTVLHSARFDLTEDKLYTLSAGTLGVISKLDEPVRLQFFYSERLASEVPGAPAYGQRVNDMLREFEVNADGKLILEITDPEPFSETEERAASSGLQGMETAGGDKFFLGLIATNMVDGKEVIPFFTQDREQFLEYDITRLIAKLSNAKKPKVGVLTGLPLDIGKGGMESVMRGEIAPFVLYEQIREIYDVEMLAQQFTEINKNIDLLLIVQPRPLDDLTRYAIDQYVLRGGRVIAFTDPISEVAKPAGRTKNPLSSPESVSPPSSLPDLFKAWGVEMDPNHIVGDVTYGQRVTVDYLNEQREVAYVAWLGLPEEAFNKADPVTGDLRHVNMAMAGHLRKIDGAATTLTPLITSSDQSALIEAAMKLRRAPNPIDLLRDFKPDGGRYVLAARLAGPSKSAFSGPPPLPKDASPELLETYKSMPPYLAEAQQPINVIIVADSDLWDDRWWVETSEVRGQRVAVPRADNGNLVMAAIDNMTGSGDLISLRSRARTTRPFTVVQDLLHNAELRYLSVEQELKDELSQTERRLASMERPTAGAPKPEGGAGESFLSAEQTAEIVRARAEVLKTRKALREVQHSLRQDVDSLGAVLRFVNIGLMPLIVMLLALLLGRLRQMRRRSRSRQLQSRGEAA